MPKKKRETDTSFDLFSPIDFFIGPFQRWTLWTGVMISIPQGMVGIIRSKTSNVKKGFITDGMIDAGFTGQIGITLINTTKKKIEFFRGDPIAQLVILPTVEVELENDI